MTTIRRFCCNDLLRFTSVNLDHLTETFNIPWKPNHGLHYGKEYRRQQLAKKLMNLLEDFSDKIDKGYFVDLFVRASNTPAIKMYEKLGYIIYRRVLRYYSGEEDGLDMRKALSRDVEKKSIIPLKRPVTPDELEYD
ncbi:hypothetical protein M0R45_010816 [Rubus argutus]|uniref:N-acetyltransferase domain-containing protein n=1 Tax=Rubus argutus TaxID=59490 RepID=A0AAW1Y8A4_RUBAR